MANFYNGIARAMIFFSILYSLIASSERALSAHIKSSFSH